MTTNLPVEISEILTQLNETQLLHLNRMIVERLKLFHRAKSLNAMKDLNVGDTVFFDYFGEKIYGVVLRLNQKSVSLKAENGKEWKVAPQLLSKFIEAKARDRFH